MDFRNTTMDDIAAVIGFTAAVRLRTWFSGRNLYVPPEMTEDNVLARLLGMSVAKRLSDEWPGEHLAVPQDLDDRISDRRRAFVWRLLRKGVPANTTTLAAAEALGITRRRAEQIVKELENAGMIEREGCRDENLTKNRT